MKKNDARLIIKEICNSHGCKICPLHDVCNSLHWDNGESLKAYRQRFYFTMLKEAERLNLVAK